MRYDDIIVGSGLSALGTAIGLPSHRKVLVLGGPDPGTTSHYSAGGGVPSSHLGFGGLGGFWHGVIPTSLRPDFSNLKPNEFRSLFRYFYPDTDPESRLHERWLFVPYRPIRPATEWRRLSAEREGRIEVSAALATAVSETAVGVQVETDAGLVESDRLWIAAGTLHSPGLLNRSWPNVDVARCLVSDHVIVYVGQIDRSRHPEIAPPCVERCRNGYWLRSFSNEGESALLTLRPARFSYRRLDQGIEQRAAFGLPVGGAIRKILKAASLGLVSEALFNKFGLLPRAGMLSVYAQLRVPDAYLFNSVSATLTPRVEAMRAAIAASTATVPWEQEIRRTRRDDLFINAIHLHGSISAEALTELGLNRPGDRIQVVDVSAVGDIGCEHHSFKMMAAAYGKARRS